MDTSLIAHNNMVAMVKAANHLDYPLLPPFLPSETFPELAGSVPQGTEINGIYPLVRQLFKDFGLDDGNYGKAEWNPLATIIRPGQSVLIKPNLVRHIHMKDGDFNAVVSHASVVRCVLDYVAKALQGSGEILVGDAPVQGADFPILISKTGLDQVCVSVAEQWGIPVSLVDFRLVAVRIDERHCISRSHQLQGDPSGYHNVDLGEASMLTPLNSCHEKFRVTSYDCKEMSKHHNQERHEYLIPKSVLTADVVINIPKLKTHRKVGMTAALKNLVGINGHKDWLPHHRCGSLAEGGDEYLHRSFIKRAQNLVGETLFAHSPSPLAPVLHVGLRALDKLSSISCRDQFREGSWYGNDTVWRMVLDLNRLLIYADKKGQMTSLQQRTVFTIVDAVVAGDGEGPMQPDPRHCGMLVCGANPLAVDTVLATLIGFDYRKMPLLAGGYRLHKWPIADFQAHEVQVRAHGQIFKDFAVGKPYTFFNFQAPDGWLGHIEFPECKSAAGLDR